MLIYDVILDVGTTGRQQTVSLYQGDDRSKMLRVTLLQNGRAYAVPADLNVRMHAVKPDDSELSAKCGVRGGSVFYLPAANVTDTQGTVSCQLQVRDHSGAVLFMPEFAMEVVATLPVPDLPQGAAEEAEYNAEVLSELSASADGKTLLFRGEPVGAVRVAAELPQSAEEDAIVYLIGEGMYRYTDEAWTQLTDDDMIALMDALQQGTHAHVNAGTLDKLTAVNDELYYDGKAVGIAVIGRHDGFPQYAAHGKIVYQEDVGMYVNTGSYQWPEWKVISMDMLLGQVMPLLGAMHTHANKSALDKFGESNGSPTFDGDPIGGVSTAATPNALPANAPDGSVAVALNGGRTTAPLAYPTQVADEEVSVNIASTDLAIGTPVYNASAINAAIAAQTLDLTATVTLEDPDGVIAFGILPVVADAASNEYTTAGITLDEAILSQSYTKKYAVSAILTAGGTDLIKPARIVQVDAGHVQIPFMAIYAFEALSNVSYRGITMDLAAGWNLALGTVDTATYSDMTAVDVVNGADLNDYVDLSNDIQNAMAIEGLRAAELFAGVIARASVLPGGLYVKLGTWKRMAEANA